MVNATFAAESFVPGNSSLEISSFKVTWQVHGKIQHCLVLFLSKHIGGVFVYHLCLLQVPTQNYSLTPLLVNELLYYINDNVVCK